jgi:hypothetical protein
MLRLGIERQCRTALQHIGYGGIYIGEVGAERTPADVVEAVRGDGQPAEADDGGSQYGERDQPHPFPGQPSSRAEGFDKRTHPWDGYQPALKGALPRCLDSGPNATDVRAKRAFALADPQVAL